MGDNMFRLSDYFEEREIISDGDFTTLGRADTDISGTLAYCDSANFLKTAIENPNVSCVISGDSLGGGIVHSSKGIVRSGTPRSAFYKLHNALLEKDLIAPDIEYGIGEGCDIHPTALISSKVKIGNNVRIAEKVIIKDHIEIGDGTFIDAGAIIGSEGILYIQEEDRIIFIKHAGGVRIGSNVTVLSSAVIVRSVHESFLTSVGNNSIVGIGSTVGHDAQVEENCVITGRCVIARRARVGCGTWIGTGSVIREYLNIGAGAKIMAGSIVVKDVGEGAVMSGNFAIDHKKNVKKYLRDKD